MRGERGGETSLGCKMNKYILKKNLQWLFPELPWYSLREKAAYIEDTTRHQSTGHMIHVTVLVLRWSVLRMQKTKLNFYTHVVSEHKNSIPSTHKGGKRPNFIKLSSDLHICAMAYMAPTPPCTHDNFGGKNVSGHGRPWPENCSHSQSYLPPSDL